MGVPRLFAALLCAPMLVLACNSLSGIGDLFVDEDASGPLAPDTGSTGETDGEVTNDGGTIFPDVAPIPAPPPTCTCAPTPPTGWSVLALLITKAGSIQSGCPTGLATTLVAGSDPQGGACSACTCGTVQGACTTAFVQAAKNQCTDPCGQLGGGSGSALVTANCTAITYCAPSISASAIMLSDAGSCPPSGGAKTGTAAFTKTATACSFLTPPGGSCDGGEVCAPTSEGAPNAPICVVKAGDNACPAGAYSERTVYYANITDSRSCSSCSCSAPNTTCTAATIALFTGANCSAADQKDTVATVANACASFNVPLPGGSAKIIQGSTLINNTGCAPSGGTLTGTLAGKDATTVCCMK